MYDAIEQQIAATICACAACEFRECKFDANLDTLFYR